MTLDPPATCELLTPGEMGEADRLTIAAGTPGSELMARAGRAVADACLKMLGSARKVAVLCGPGNNGGDGFVAARLLREAGCSVVLALLGLRDTLRGDAAGAAAGWTGPVDDPAAIDPGAFDLVVDALFGAGLSRPVDGVARQTIERLNASGTPVLAVDIPSGIDGETGRERGVAVRAATTVTFFRAKPGHYLFPGAARRGRLHVADIGIGPEVLETIRPRAGLNMPAAWLDRFPWPEPDGHKYKRGHAVVLSGGASHTGAARLSARAALRVGAGLVTLASPSDALAVNAAQLTAIMVHVADGAAGFAAILSDGQKNAVVLGPGLGVGTATRDHVAAALSTRPARGADAPPRACVLDADALTSFAGDAASLHGLVGQATGPVVITPHTGEFARLFEGRRDVTAPASKLDQARAAAAALGCIVVLKGPDTVVAEPDGRAVVADGGSPWLATAGSGDVLSGLIGGLLAQDMPAFEAANAAVWLHAASARRFGPGLIAEDIPETLPSVLRELFDAAHPKG